MASTPLGRHIRASIISGAVTGIDAIAADLRKKGVEFTQEPHSPRPGIKICFLRGPQGISIELLDRDPKYA
jgi:hypothetical protein